MSAEGKGPGGANTAEPATADDLLPGDAYEDGPFLVFTAQYHLRRGSCCHSGCRHCPYGDEPGS